jgi:hypothetical protein
MVNLIGCTSYPIPYKPRQKGNQEERVCLVSTVGEFSRVSQRSEIATGD